MVQIQVTGPEHSGKGYIMTAITRALRDLGVEVVLQGEETHLEEKAAYNAEVWSAKLRGQTVQITELKTRV
jgi:hypothetical protein